jgi:hypothetical protein
MRHLNHLWVRYGTPRNRRVAYIVLALVTLAVAGGAPSAGGGVPGGGPCGIDSPPHLWF